jgi:hypothetical protein
LIAFLLDETSSEQFEDFVEKGRVSSRGWSVDFDDGILDLENRELILVQQDEMYGSL